MLIKTYQSYIIKLFIKNLIIITGIFVILSFFLNVLEEVKFFEKFDINIYYPIFLTFLNIPSITFELFPFIFLISTQFFFIKLYENEELITLKKFGITNLKILKIILIASLMSGIFISTIFYSFSSHLKHSYLSLKNKYTDDNKYLAVVNENGLWLKDEINNKINIINANIFEKNILGDITISQLDKDFNLTKTFIVEKANIEKNTWKLENVNIFAIDGTVDRHKNFDFKSNFNVEMINNIFSNLSSLSYFELLSLYKDYDSLGYATLEIKSYLYKLYSFPIYLMLMSIIGCILMFNVKYNKSKIFHIIIGIIFSVLVYYVNFLSNLLGTNEKVPVLISNGLPYLILLLICLIGMVRLNEK